MHFFFLLFFFLVGPSAGKSFADDLKFLKDISTELSVSLDVFEGYVIKKDLIRKGSENVFRSEDPFELNNLIDKKQKVAYELEQRLFNWLKSVGQDSNFHKRILEDTFN